MAHTVGYKEDRPWGGFEVLAVDSAHVVKRLVVNPGKRLSDQRHEGRVEHWVCVDGVGLVHLEFQDGRKETITFSRYENSTITIPTRVWHRLDNTGGGAPLVIIETWVGLTCDEADIERRDDDFGRVEVAA